MRTFLRALDVWIYLQVYRTPVPFKDCLEAIRQLDEFDKRTLHV